MHFVDNEGVSILNHFRRLHSSVIHTIFTRMDTAGIPSTAIQISLIKSLHHYVKRMAQLGIPINPIAITFELLEVENALMEDSKAAATTTSKPRIGKDHTKWRAFRDVFTNYLYSIKGARGVPLSYVIRWDGLQLEINDPIYTTPHNRELWKADNAEVFNILKRCALGGPGEVYVKGHAKSRNGRHAFLELNDIYDGATVIATKSSAAWKTICSTKFTGKRPNFDFQAYRSAMDEAFRDLHECGTRLNDADKVQFLLQGMEGEDARAIRDGMVNGATTRNNYLEAVLYISNCMANDSIVDQKPKADRIVSNVTNRNYSNEEWSRLSAEDKEKVRQLRRNTNGDTNTRSSFSVTNITQAYTPRSGRGGRWNVRGRSDRNGRGGRSGLMVVVVAIFHQGPGNSLDRMVVHLLNPIGQSALLMLMV